MECQQGFQTLLTWAEKGESWGWGPRAFVGVGKNASYFFWGGMEVPARQLYRD